MLAAVLGLLGFAISSGLFIDGIRGSQRDLPREPEAIRWRTFRRAYPATLIGLASGMALGATMAQHRGVALDTMSGVAYFAGGALIGSLPGAVLAYRGSREYERALDEHYAGTPWARRTR